VELAVAAWRIALGTCLGLSCLGVRANAADVAPAAPPSATGDAQVAPSPDLAVRREFADALRSGLFPAERVRPYQESRRERGMGGRVPVRGRVV